MYLYYPIPCVPYRIQSTRATYQAISSDLQKSKYSLMGVCLEWRVHSWPDPALAHSSHRKIVYGDQYSILCVRNFICLPQIVNLTHSSLLVWEIAKYCFRLNETHLYSTYAYSISLDVNIRGFTQIRRLVQLASTTLFYLIYHIILSPSDTYNQPEYLSLC